MCPSFTLCLKFSSITCVAWHQVLASFDALTGHVLANICDTQPWQTATSLLPQLKASFSCCYPLASLALDEAKTSWNSSSWKLLTSCRCCLLVLFRAKNDGVGEDLSIKKSSSFQPWRQLDLSILVLLLPFTGLEIIFGLP